MKESLREHKRWRRREIAGIREELTDRYITEASAVIADRLLETEEYSRANTVMCYLDYGKEVRTSAIVERL